MTTTSLRRRWSPIATLRFWASAYGDVMLIIGILLAIVVGAGLTRLGVWLEDATAAPAPVVLLATATLPALPATAAPLAVASVPTLSRAVAAFAEPNGALLGDAPAGSAYTVVYRNPEGWALLQVAGIGGYDGAGLVWVTPSDSPPEAAHAPVVATAVPAPPPQIVIVQQQPAPS
jgi:hypothetical protein